MRDDEAEFSAEDVDSIDAVFDALSKEDLHI